METSFFQWALALFLLLRGHAPMKKPTEPQELSPYQILFQRVQDDMDHLFQDPRFSDYKLVHPIFQGTDLLIYHIEFYGFSRRMFVMGSSDEDCHASRGIFETHYRAQYTRKVPYLEVMTDPLPIWKGPNFKYCVMLGEWGEDISYPIFTASFQMKKTKNTEAMVRFIGRMVEAFAHLNSHVNIYHTNVNLQTVLGVWEGYELTPRITNLQQAFQMKSFYERAEFRVYDSDHRPPEIDKVATRSVFPNSEADRMFENYMFDMNFKEDAYALGVTIFELLETNEQFLNPKSKSLEKVKKIIRMMMTEDPELRNSARKTLKLLRENVPKIEEITKPVFWVDSSDFSRESVN